MDLKTKLQEAGLCYPGPHDQNAMNRIRAIAAECGLFVAFSFHGPRGNPETSGFLRSVGEHPDRGHKCANAILGDPRPSLVDFYAAQYARQRGRRKLA